MSFSTNIKEELIRIRVKNADQRLSQLSGMTLTSGGIRIARRTVAKYRGILGIGGVSERRADA